MNRIGDVILTARRAAGITQEELAETLGVTQAALSRYENNLRTPEPEMAEAIAKALGVTVAFLTHPFNLQGAIAVDAHMRRQRTAKVSDWRSGEARLNMYRMRSAYLLERLGLNTQNQVPTFDPDSPGPAEAARLVRAQWRMPIGPVRNLTRWMESAGILVVEIDFGTHRIDGMSQWASEYPVVMVNVRHTPDRRRMTLAHELGHLVLHSTFVSEDMEQQADQFAVEFLMPEHVIRRDLTGAALKPARLRDLKAVWGVSMQALYERAYQFGRVTGEERQRFYRYLNSQGWKTNEPGVELLQEEHPELATSIVDALQSKGLDREEIAQLTGMSWVTETDPFTPSTRGLRMVR
ncbi:XRE family transcriptional regulator [Nocardia nova]|uniref:XRE family transcriptional regulator n=1 Tax=Nocardia nova TaxID=37330 RepID=A0A2S6A4X7_9NOCA|nr:XRE family transcriptional regulator [Nocardia nova]PPJ27234.1 XRE family transcriptional regulator [Nocardia nova]